MSLLRVHERERDLPARLGDHCLILPGDEEFAQLVRRHLCEDSEPELAGLELVHARWKAGLSLSGMWEVQLASGERRFVSLKLHLDGAGAKRASYERPNEHVAATSAPLRSFASLRGGAATLVTMPADRCLRGLARVMNLRKCARLLDETELWRPLVMRRRSSTLELLRYKPERRAVLRLEARLKSRSATAEPDPAASPGSVRRMGVRVLPPERAQRAAHARTEIDPSLGPRLLHADGPTGTLFEEWLDGSVHAPDDFAHALAAGATLARLHATPASGRTRARDRFELESLAARVPNGLLPLTRVPPAPSLSAQHSIHGDFHPDQCIETLHGMRLLDLDELGAGAPEEDLASWIADALREAPDARLRDVSGPLLEGYRSGGGRLRRTLLADFLADDLVARAAAGLRRLEAGAVARALRLIERAGQVAHEKVVE